MTAMLAVVIGSLYATGVYMLLRRSIAKLLIGLMLLSHAANLLVFVASGARRARPPLIAEGAQVLAEGAADPLPQALVLTAIVISLGVLAFAIALVHRVQEAAATDDLDKLRSTDEP